MINIRLADNYASVTNGDIDKYVMLLSNKDSVEREYKQLIEWDNKVFKDEMSLKIMGAIDNAERVGAYGVRTPIGKSCITCLSSGCKLALLLWHYRDSERVVIVTKFSRAGNNVWEFIAENFDINIVMLKEEFLVPYDLKIDLTLDGVLYSGENGHRDLFFLRSELEDEPYKITKEKELDAYNKYIKHRNERYFYRQLKEELPLKDFISGLKSDKVYSDFEEFLSLDYTVINYLPIIQNDLGYRRLPIWFLRPVDGDYKLHCECSVKYPKFLELILYDIVDSGICKDADTYFVLVPEGEERCKIDEYPQNTKFGVLIERQKKQITIYDSYQAVKKFHELYLLTKDGDEMHE